jgi:hypothetical protein
MTEVQVQTRCKSWKHVAVSLFTWLTLGNAEV